MSLDASAIGVLSIILLSTLFRSTFGFGDALIGMPLLALLIDVKLAAPLVALVSLVVAATILINDWRDIHIQSAWRLVVFAMFGIPVGLLFLTHVDERIVKAALAVLVIGFSMYSLLTPRLVALNNDKLAGIFGFAAGVLGGAYNTHGPPLVIYGALRRWSAENFRSTLQAYFLPTGLLILVGHYQMGLWVPKLFWYFGYSLPLVFLAVFAGKGLNRKLHGMDVTRIVHAFLIVVGTMLLVESIRG